MMHDGFLPTCTYSIEGAISPECQESIDRDWDSLKKAGQNGFVSALASLAWWGNIVSAGSCSNLRSKWEAALEECYHVFVSLLAAK